VSDKTKARPRKPALILAGGGLKVAFQAGVLQVWLDEVKEPIGFELADGASGGVFNLAMLCQGMTGTEIADAWRRTVPMKLIGPNLLFWRSLLTFGRFRKNILRKVWGLDWKTIQAWPKPATFNTYNFTATKPRMFEASEMTEDKLIACVSLPGWFEPAKLDGDNYIDAVYYTDANLLEAIDRGATELWVIWTVSTSGRWRNGPFHQYFQIVEAAADSHFNEVRDRIEKSNDLLAAGKKDEAEFKWPIKIMFLPGKVPIDYMLVFRARPLHEAVELGVQEARKWCKENKIDLKPPKVRRPPDPSTLRFTETMIGHFEVGADDTETGEDHGKASGTSLRAHLTVHLDGVRNFLKEPKHRAKLSGSIFSDALGGELQVEGGEIELFPLDSDSGLRKLIYRVDFRDGAGHPLTLHGEKYIEKSRGFHPWRQTTTLYTRITRGPDGVPVGAGVIYITMSTFLHQLVTFRAWGRPNTLRGMFAGIWYIVRFQAFFIHQLWRVYMSR
jgi:predicted acylesterase/phospholipase RssA